MCRTGRRTMFLSSFTLIYSCSCCTVSVVPRHWENVTRGCCVLDVWRCCRRTMICCERTRRSWHSLEFPLTSSASSLLTRQWVVSYWARARPVSCQRRRRVSVTCPVTWSCLSSSRLATEKFVFCWPVSEVSATSMARLLMLYRLLCLNAVDLLYYCTVSTTPHTGRPSGL